MDFYHEKYDAIVEKRREAGKNGGTSKSAKKKAAAIKNGRTGGAPEGNRNAMGNRGGGAPMGNRNAVRGSSTPEVETEPEKQTQPKHLLRLNKTNSTQAELVVSNQYIESEKEDSSSNPSGAENQPRLRTTTTADTDSFISECQRHGFFISANKAREILDTGIDPAWLSGEFSFLEYMAQFVSEKYPDKPHEQLTSIFIKALEYEDRREEYQAIKDGRIKSRRKSPSGHRIANDNVADEDIDKYFRTEV
jgi:hypothetical protein